MINRFLTVVAICLAGAASSATAQPSAAPGTLRLTVVDQTNAVIIGATVTVTSAEPAAKAAAIAPVATADGGIATIAGLAPGRYTVQAEFPGFETRILKDVRIRSGDNKQVAVLPIQKMEANVTVGQDKQQAAADPRGRSFGTTLTREEIEALSDDPQTLQQQLQDMAGPGAVIRIDGFEGGALPAKAQIRSIRISRDQFAAEFHEAGGTSIEIITQPGLGPIRYFSNFRFRDSALSGRSPFVTKRGPESNLNGGFGMGGTLVKEKASFNLNVFGTNSYDTPNLNVVLPTGTKSEALTIKSPRSNLFANAFADYAVTLDQTLRFAYNLTRFTNSNLGIGGYDQPERAYSNENRVHNFRAQHFGPLGRRMFSRSRMQVFWSDSDATSATEAPTVIVNGSFTSGGAQLSGGEHARRINFGSDLDYVRGRHSFRAGMLLDAGWYRSDSSSNYLGTYTFDNLDAYLLNRPSNYTRRVGDPNLTYRAFQAAFYIQDDIRPRKNLTLSPGLRYEVQTHVGDVANLGPRFGVTWAPWANGRTTLRGSAGLFYDWLPNGTYEQSLRVDGVHQQELNVFNPSYPDPGNVGIVPPINRYLLGDGYTMPQTLRFSAGVDQQIYKTTRVAATYSYQDVSDVARGLNLNASLNGIRPNALFRNIVEVVSDAASRQHRLQIDANIHPGAMLPDFKGPRVNWKRTTVFVNYTLAQLRNNSDGPFTIPATGDLGLEWGPALNADVRNRFSVQFNNQIIRNFLIGLNVAGHTGEAYTLLTGRDDNGDGIFNDRPSGVGRNTLRADGQATANLFLAYILTFGRYKTALPPGIAFFGGAGSDLRTFDQGQARYRLQLFFNAQNLTNTANYFGYNGMLTSPFFGKPTTVREMRKIDFGLGLQF